MLAARAQSTAADNPAMHLVIPFASGVSEDAAAALHSLSLPRLERLLPRLEAGATVSLDTGSLNLPHEVVLARLRGWQGVDGCLPFAAHNNRMPLLACMERSRFYLMMMMTTIDDAKADRNYTVQLTVL